MEEVDHDLYNILEENFEADYELVKLVEEKFLEKRYELGAELSRQ